MDENKKAEQRCLDLSAKLIHAGYDKSQPIDRVLAIGTAECVAYLLGRITSDRAIPKDGDDYALTLLIAVKGKLFRWSEDPELEDARHLLDFINEQLVPKSD